MTLHLRALTKPERARAFASKKNQGVDLGEYRAAVREMEPDVAYAIRGRESEGGPPVAAYAERVRLGRAAKELGVPLKWAAARRNSAEQVVELGE